MVTIWKGEPTDEKSLAETQRQQVDMWDMGRDDDDQLAPSSSQETSGTSRGSETLT